MAPRPREHISQVIQRIRAGLPVRYGAPHHTHAVLFQEGRYRVRQLVLSRAKADAFRASRGGRFSPEDAEDLSEPTGDIELDCATIEELISALLAK